MTPRRTSPRRRSAPASPARGASSCRSRSRAVVGFVFLLALTTHLPNLKTLFPADARGRRSGRRTASTTSAAASPSSTSWSTTSADLGDLLAAGIAIAMAFCGLSSVASAGRMLYAFSRDDGAARLRLAQEGVAPLPDAGQLAGRDRRRRRGCSRSRRSRRRPGTAIVIITAISTIFLYAAYGDRASTSARRRRTGSRSASGVWAAGRSPSPGSRSFWVLVLMVLFSFPTSGNISWPFMVGDRRASARLLLRLGAVDASRVRGPWATRRADRDRARVRARGRGGRRPPDHATVTRSMRAGRHRRPAPLPSSPTEEDR